MLTEKVINVKYLVPEKDLVRAGYHYDIAKPLVPVKSSAAQDVKKIK